MTSLFQAHEEPVPAEATVSLSSKSVTSQEAFEQTTP